jgi:hypothetical protein
LAVYPVKFFEKDSVADLTGACPVAPGDGTGVKCLELFKIDK